MTLTLIRGLPGSGKSTFAKTLDAVHLETDMYFVDPHGDYHFQPTQLKVAHQWCFQEVERYLSVGKDVVVSNTFVQYWEMKPYVELAKRLGAKLSIIVCEQNFGTIHNIEAVTLKRMQKKWEPCRWLAQTRL